MFGNKLDISRKNHQRHLHFGLTDQKLVRCRKIQISLKSSRNTAKHISKSSTGPSSLMLSFATSKGFAAKVKGLSQYRQNVPDDSW